MSYNPIDKNEKSIGLYSFLKLNMLKALSLIITITLFYSNFNIGILSSYSTPNNKTDIIYPLYGDSNFFLSAIMQNKKEPIDKKVTGITVPHHLLAKDLIAEIFSLISDNQYSSIVIISPDHYHQGETSISTNLNNFKTAFGILETDKDKISILLENENISSSNLFLREHGIQSLTPFIKYYFPNTKIIPITIKITSKKEEIDMLYNEIISIISKDDTLIIQSTDFSHYLTKDEADIKDKETKDILLKENAHLILDLKEPDNLDSKYAQYIQMRLQKEFFKSNINIIHNKNSESYSEEVVDETTSYITQIYTAE